MKITEVHVALDQQRADALLQRTLRGLGSVELWWLGRLIAGAPTHRARDWHRQVTRATLYQDYAFWCRGKPVSAGAFGKTLLRLAPGTRNNRQTIELRRVNCYLLPMLRETRERFEQLLGVPLAWTRPKD